MDNSGWVLQPISSFVYLLHNRRDRQTILQQRFKKNASALKMLYKTIEKVDELGYDLGVEFAFQSHRFDTIRNHGNYSLIEIRVKDTLWRAITYWSKPKRLFVILDAFEAHKHQSLEEKVKQIAPLAQRAKELTEEID